MQRTMRFLARATAVLGGVVLCGLVVLTTLSIAGRVLNDGLHALGAETAVARWILSLGVGEIRGSYELLEAGIAFAIFCFLPICQLHGAHAVVDVFTARLPGRGNRWLAAFWETVLTASLIFVSWRLYEGMLRYLGNGETTLFLQFPLWWGYLACVIASGVICLVGVYCAVCRVVEAVTDRACLPGA